MLDRLFGEGGFFGAGAWWIIVLFFLFAIVASAVFYKIFKYWMFLHVSE